MPFESNAGRPGRNSEVGVQAFVCNSSPNAEPQRASDGSTCVGDRRVAALLQLAPDLGERWLEPAQPAAFKFLSSDAPFSSASRESASFV